MLSRHNRTSLMLIWLWTAGNWKALALGLSALTLFTLFSINQPLARIDKTCRYIRWTVEHDYFGRVHPRVFCELPDGRTIIAKAPQNWQPPTPVSTIKIEEQTLLFGTGYRVK